MKKSIRQSLRAGHPTIGSWMQLPSASVAEIMGKAGFDWVALDLEHGSFALDSLPDICRAIELGGSVPFARVGENSCKDIKQAIEAGAKGIIIPMIESRQEIEQAIAWAKYPPEGKRGVGYSRANLFGRRFKEYFATINDELVITAQIESIGAIHRLDEILTVPGVDAMMIGPYDLSASMNLTGQFDHPDFTAALALARSKAEQHRIPMGLHIVQPDPAVLRAKIAEGYRFIAYGIDAVFLYSQAVNPLNPQP
jgi:2-dehydro-3-deoxyglucarate aldolase